MQFERNEFFTVKQVADRLKIHRSTVYRAVKSGELSALKFGTTSKGALRLPGWAVNAWLGECFDAAYAQFVEGDQSPELADVDGGETVEVA
ncbi:helix-turn-helix domain-containing protein [Amycolatopsis suaedae]|uniref:DNA-binding protein n=1 Tax=Amycolatopsis suaedae TaxID=2510978 RepID=A0A4Q7JAS0_9PSEU|nr:helix-turn-helix domain-containing protein [Amycolatopsis suaedae]RZQ64367.1 DNA-binding protein [Amycolatopsis suaedae]